MEGWLDGKAITIAGYSPQLLGRDDAAALSGFLNRMEGLIAFSSERAEKLRHHVAALKARENLPLSLECASETARVCADVLHTLFAVALDTPREPSLSGRVVWPERVTLPGHGAKVLLLGTTYSTLTDGDGLWSFRNLPATGRLIAIERRGTRTVIGGETEVMLHATDPAGNLVRNPDFMLRWSTPERPEHWTAIAPPQKLRGFESANTRVSRGTVYRLGGAAMQTGTRIGVRWRQHHAITSFANIVWPEGQAAGELTSPEDALYAQVLVLTDRALRFLNEDSQPILLSRGSARVGRVARRSPDRASGRSPR